VAQTIRYNALPIPELAATPDAVVPQFERVRKLTLPGILLDDVGTDEATAMATLTPIFAACGITIHTTMPPIHSKQGNVDQPLHIDSIPYDHDSIGMVVQRTGIGSADIVLARLADPFCEELRQRNAGRDIEDLSYDLPEGIDALLDDGLVDPDVLQPDVYIGSVAAGKAIMFTFGGPNPIAHRLGAYIPCQQTSLRLLAV
jgi:hypothetical protein